GEMTRRIMIGARTHLQGRFLLGADVLGLPAAGTEPAPRRRIDRAGHVPGQDDLFASTPQLRIRHRTGRSQSLSIGVDSTRIDLLFAAVLDDLAQVHHSVAICYIPS